MAHYDDWVYERGLENEDWVHDRWGDDDDWDDDYDNWSDNNDSEGEDEDMEQTNNRISFVKNYTNIEKMAIDTKISRILKEFSDMEIGPCSFKLNNEITCIYFLNGSSYPDKFTFIFEYKDNYNNYSLDKYFAKSLFIIKYESEIKQELLDTRKTFDESEKSVFDITYTREDGFDNIFKAIELGIDINIDSFLELPDLTNDEIKILIKNGYGYDAYFQENIPYEVKNDIKCKAKNDIRNLQEFRHIRDGNEALEIWIKENPNKCILPKNRHPLKEYI